MPEANLWHQFQRAYDSSQVLQYLLPLIPIILFIYLALVVAGWSESRELEHRQLQKRVTRLSQLTSATDWHGLLQQERQRQERLSPLIWSAKSVELGRADLQTALNTLLKDKIIVLRVRFAEPRWLEQGALWSIPVEVSGRLNEGDAVSLFVALNNHRPRLAVEQLNYSPQRSGLISMQMLALLDVAAESGGDDASAEVMEE